MAGGETVRAILDANVLYSAFLRDVLLRLAAADLYRPCWSARIHDEWMRNLLAHRPDLSPARVARTRDRMDAAFPDARVTGHEGLDARFPDVAPGDRHVAAAALGAGANYIVTRNLRDFPPAALGSHGIAAVDPDAFIQMLRRPRLRPDPAGGAPAGAPPPTPEPGAVPGGLHPQRARPVRRPPLAGLSHSSSQRRASASSRKTRRLALTRPSVSSSNWRPRP